MTRKSAQIFISIFLLIISWVLSLHYVSANTNKTIKITKNYQNFIDFSVYPDFKDLYYSDSISIDILPNNKLSLIEKDNTLVFWVKPWVTEIDALLEISLPERKYSFPIEFDMAKDLQDFSLFSDMYELSIQEKSLSCESAATADILESLLWKKIHEDEVINILPKWSHYNILPEEHPEDIKIWGNPELWFVWYIDSNDEINAKQKLMTGYGVYEAPISDVYQDYWFSTKIMNISNHSSVITPEIHLRYLLEKIKSWSMVQLWWDWCSKLEYDDGILDSKKEIKDLEPWEFISAKNTCFNVDEDRSLSWKYYDNNWNLVDHLGLDWEHAFILLWWKWSISSPSHIRVWDTDTGYHLYPKKEWMRKWKAMNYRSIIIAKKDSN